MSPSVGLVSAGSDSVAIIGRVSSAAQGVPSVRRAPAARRGTASGDRTSRLNWKSIVTRRGDLRFTAHSAFHNKRRETVPERRPRRFSAPEIRRARAGQRASGDRRKGEQCCWDEARESDRNQSRARLDISGRALPVSSVSCALRAPRSGRFATRRAMLIRGPLRGPPLRHVRLNSSREPTYD